VSQAHNVRLDKNDIAFYSPIIVAIQIWPGLTGSASNCRKSNAQRQLALLRHNLFIRTVKLKSFKPTTEAGIISDVRFDDVRGVDEVKEELMDVVEYLRDPKRFTDLGAKLPKGSYTCCAVKHPLVLIIA